MEDKSRLPWELAKETGKTIIQRIMGPMVGVYYPYRKTGDLYIALDGKPVHCCQCDADFPLEQFDEHIESHDKRRNRKRGKL